MAIGVKAQRSFGPFFARLGRACDTETQGKGAERSLKLKTPELFLGARADHRVATIKARAINLPLGFGDIGNNFRRYAAALCGRHV